MDMKVVFVLIFCLAIPPDCCIGCTQVVQSFLTVRDAINEYFTSCSKFERDLDEIEELLGFPFVSDENWRGLLCDLADADDFSDVINVLKDHLAMPIDAPTTLTILRNLKGVNIPEALVNLEKYQRKVQPWLVKTDFPHVWPVPNTGRRETVRLLSQGNEINLGLLTYGVPFYNTNYKKWAKTLINADRLDDYLRVVNRRMIGDDESQECFAVMFDKFRDNEYFAELPLVRQAFLRMIDAFKEMGLFDMAFESYQDGRSDDR